MSVEVYEPVQLVVDNLVLQGAESGLLSTNAVSKAYVDSHISSAVSALVNSAPATLDILKEIATALNNDANLATTLTNSIGSEATARIAGDASLLTQINTKVTDVGNWAGNLVHVEQVARIAGDAEESKRAQLAESKEATDRANADAGLQSQITALSGSSGTSVSTLQAQIDTEVTARTGADTDLRAYVDSNHNAESNARITEDGMINQRISDEIINRENLVYQVSDSFVQTSSSLNMRCDLLSSAMTAESNARIAEDSILRTDFNESDRLIHERLNTLGMNMENEGTSRNDADVELSTRCDNFVTSIFNEKTERKSEDVLIRASIVAVNEDLASESVERASAVTALQSTKFNKSGGTQSSGV